MDRLETEISRLRQQVEALSAQAISFHCPDLVETTRHEGSAGVGFAFTFDLQDKVIRVKGLRSDAPALQGVPCKLPNVADKIVQLHGTHLFTDGEVKGSPPPPPDPLDAARQRGRQAAAQLQRLAGGAWSGAQLKERFQLSSATLHRRRADHRVVFWRDALHVFHYPKWQFTETGAVRPGLKDVLDVFQSDDGWRLTQYFLTPRQQLDDESPLTLINHGQIERVIAHAKLHLEEDSW